MIEPYAIRKAVKDLEEQFEEEGQKIYFRKEGKGPKIEVSISERYEIVRNFHGEYRRFFWQIMIISGLYFLIIEEVVANTTSTPVFQFLLTIFSIIIFLGLLYPCHEKILNAPSRKLENRKSVSDALDEKAAIRLSFSKISYAQLSLACIGGMGLIVLGLMLPPTLADVDIIMFVLGGSLIALAAVQAVRKWRMARYPVRCSRST